MSWRRYVTHGYVRMNDIHLVVNNLHFSALVCDLILFRYEQRIYATHIEQIESAHYAFSPRRL